MYEQSSRNVVAYNSMTHGGDGLFLWAGQTHDGHGPGRRERQLFYGNDFSFAPTNGIEATFSRNTFVANASRDLTTASGAATASTPRSSATSSSNNRTGIAIEHGQNNDITDNASRGDTIAIRLWANAIEPTDWGYPKHRDTRSRDYVIAGNTFTRNRVGIARSEHGRGQYNGNASTAWTLCSSRRDSAPRGRVPPRAADCTSTAPHRFPARSTLAPPTASHRDRSAIIVDEWGPYDWRSPKRGPSTPRTRAGRLRVLGRPAHGASSTAAASRRCRANGRVNDTIARHPARAPTGRFTLDYGGPRRGRRADAGAAGAPYEFSYGAAPNRPHWYVLSSPGPTADRAATEYILGSARQPVATVAHAARLFWYRPTITGVPQEKWAAVATTTVTLGPAHTLLRTISDDGDSRVDRRELVIDDWKPHESAVDYAPIARAVTNPRRVLSGRGMDRAAGGHRSRGRALGGSPGPHEEVVWSGR